VAKKKKKRKIPLRTQLRRLAKKADRVLSEYARALAIAEYKGRCPFCGRDPVLPVPSKDGKKMRKNGWVCFHFIRRRRRIVRWVLENVVGACAFCNRIEVGNPDPYRAWFIRNRGVELYLQLVDRSNEQFEPTIEFLQGVVDMFASKLETLKSKANETDTTHPGEVL
jgi:hypothetical protein